MNVKKNKSLLAMFYLNTNKTTGKLLILFNIINHIRLIHRLNPKAYLFHSSPYKPTY